MRFLGISAEEIDALLRRHVASTEENIERILVSADLSKLGDAYLNFLYSLAESTRTGELCSLRVSNRTLGNALRRARLRPLLGSRVSLQDLGGAAEALILAAVVRGIVSSGEVVEALSRSGDLEASVAQLLMKIRESWR